MIVEKENINELKKGVPFFILGIYLLSFVLGYVGANWQQIIIFSSSNYNINDVSIEGAMTAYSNNLPILFTKGCLKFFEGDPQIVSRLVSGFTLSFIGVTGFMISLCFTLNNKISFIITLVVLSCESLKYRGSTYDLYMNTGITIAEYGPIIPAFAFSLFALRFWRTGFLIVGFLPSFHLIMGTFSIAMIFVALLIHKDGRTILQNFWMYLIPGVSIFLTLSVYSYFNYPLIESGGNFIETNRYVTSFSSFPHYLNINQFTYDTVKLYGNYSNWLFLLFLLGITVLLFVFFKKSDNNEKRLSARFFIYLSVFSILLSVSLGLLASNSETWLGSIALRSMPLRSLANMSSIAGFILLALFYDANRKRSVVVFYLIIFVLFLFAIYQGITGYFLINRYIIIFFLYWSIIFYCLCHYLFRLDKYFSSITIFFNKVIHYLQTKNIFSKFIFSGTFVLIFSIACFTFTKIFYETRKGAKYWENWSNNSFWLGVHKNKGKLLVSSVTPFQIQIFSGTKLLIWIHEITALPYVPQIGPNLESMFTDVYGNNLITGNSFSFSKGDEKDAFQKRTHKDWILLAHKYNFTGVIVPEDWKLDLTLVDKHSLSNEICGNTPTVSCKLAYYTIE